MKSFIAIAMLVGASLVASSCETPRGQAGGSTSTQAAQTVGQDQQQAGSTNFSKVEVTVKVIGHGGELSDEVVAMVQEQLAEFDKSLADPNLTAADKVNLVNARASFIYKINQHGTVRVEVKDSDSSIGSGTGAGAGTNSGGNAPSPTKEPTPVEPD